MHRYRKHLPAGALLLTALLVGCQDRVLPTAVLLPPNAPNFDVAVVSGALESWGWNDDGQVSGTPGGDDFIAVAAGGRHGAAIRGNGSLISWGSNADGLVSGTPAGNDFIAIAAGGYHSVALRDDETLVAWGNDGHRQVTDTPGEDDFVAVAAGEHHSVALRWDGGLVSWGSNSNGQVSGTPTTGSYRVVAAGGYHSVAMGTDGSLISWGRDVDRQVTDTPGGNGFIAVAAGGHHSVAIRSDGSLHSWGSNSNDQVSDTPSGNDFVAVDAGDYHSVALRSNGTLVSWGWDGRDQVSDTPSQNDFWAVAAGGYHNVAIRSDLTPPVVTPDISGTLGNNGWYTSDVTVSWTVVDAESDIISQTGCETTTISSDTDSNGTTLTCAATSAGGTASQSVTIRRDVTPPTLEPSVTPDPVLLGAEATASPNANDAASGVASASCDPVDTGSVGDDQTVSCTATDVAGNTATAHATYSVIEPPSDDTPPVITVNVTGTLGNNDWYRSDVTVSWSVVDKESEITSTEGCEDTPIDYDTPEVTFTCQAESAGGQSSQSVTVKRDATPPTLSPSVSPDPVVLHGSATASANASDTLSGVASESCGTLNTSTVGTRTVTCTATDDAGNQASTIVSYSVIYAFSGFSAPVHDPPVTNVAKAGQAIPLRWQLLDASGSPVTSLTGVNLTVRNLNCAIDGGDNEVTESATGRTGLLDLGNGHYQFNWQTPRSYANSCRTLHLDLGEGITRTAQFQFTR